MRHFAALIVGLSLAGLAGCAPTRPAHDVEHAMRTELAHAIVLENDALVAMDDELAHAIGTTTLTSAVVAGPAFPADEAMPLPDDRMPLTAAFRTWGAPDESFASPDNRD